MISINIQTKSNRIPAIKAAIRPTVSKVVRKTALDFEAEVKLEMHKPKTGRTYRRGRRTHQASAPGESPAVDYGLLINSIQTNMINDLTAQVGSNVIYAPALEYGLRFAPRPVWRPVAEKLKKPFIEALTYVLRQLK